MPIGTTELKKCTCTALFFLIGKHGQSSGFEFEFEFKFQLERHVQVQNCTKVWKPTAKNFQSRSGRSGEGLVIPSFSSTI